MKPNWITKQNRICLVGILLFSLGCSKPAEVTPSATTISTGKEIPNTTVAPIAEPEALRQLRAQANEEKEEAIIAVGYVGEFTLEEIGQMPMDNAMLANYEWIDQIDEAHRVEAAEEETLGEVYCIFPVDINDGMSVSIVNPHTEEIQEELYRSETGEPILLRCTKDVLRNTKVFITSTDGTQEYWPGLIAFCGQGYVKDRLETTCYDFTIYPSRRVGKAINQPDGIWKAKVQPSILNGQWVSLTLSIPPLSEPAELVLTDLESGAFMVSYQGYWLSKEDHKIYLDLTVQENCTGMEAFNTPITVTYQTNVSSDFHMTLSLDPADHDSFYVHNPEESIEFEPAGTYNIQSEQDQVFCELVLDYYESTHAYRPTYSVVDSREGEELLIHLYDDLGDHIVTSGWYLIDPNTLQGSDYVTGETIDFSDMQK